MGYRRTGRSFFERDVLDVAPDLLGCVLKNTDSEGAVAIRITEVEAYAGERDPGAHSFRGKTARNATMFGPAGHIYCYFTYGLHHAINLVTSETGQPYGCLIRAGRVVEGEALARARRAAHRRSSLRDRDLARGPGCVAQVFDVTLANNGDDLFAGAWQFFVPDAPREFQPAAGPRAGVSGPAGRAERFPWRFWIPGESTVSVYRPGRSM